MDRAAYSFAVPDSTEPVRREAVTVPQLMGRGLLYAEQRQNARPEQADEDDDRHDQPDSATHEGERSAREHANNALDDRQRHPNQRQDPGPLLFAYLDYSRKRAGLGLSVVPTGDIPRDMDRIREFYEGMRGKKPKSATTIRLADEGEPAGMHRPRQTTACDTLPAIGFRKMAPVILNGAQRNAVQ